MLDNVTRIADPLSGLTLFQDAPVIFTGIYDHGGLGQQVTKQFLLDNFGDMRLHAERVKDDFTDRLDTITCTLQEYFERAEDGSNARWSQQRVPVEMRESLGLPTKMTPTRDDVNTLLYVGNSGIAMSLHFDVDFRNALATQLIGRKRYVLIDPRLSKRLSPYFNYSLIAFQNLSHEEQLEFIRYNHGYECVVGPGETLYLPRSWWHYVEYLDFSVTISVRYARRPFANVFSMLPRSYLLQNLANELVDERLGSIKHVECYKELLHSYFRCSDGVVKLYERYYETIERLYAKLCTHALQGAYIDSRFSLEHNRIREGRGLWERLEVPFAYENDDPDAPMTKSQSKLLAKYLSKVKDSEFVISCMGVTKPIEKFSCLEAAYYITSSLFPIS